MLLWVIRICMLSFLVLMTVIMYKTERKGQFPAISVVLAVIVAILWFTSMNRVNDIVENSVVIRYEDKFIRVSEKYTTDYIVKMIGEEKSNQPTNMFEMLITR